MTPRPIILINILKKGPIFDLEKYMIKTISVKKIKNRINMITETIQIITMELDKFLLRKNCIVEILR